MIKLNELKENDTIWKVYENSSIIKRSNIRNLNKHGSTDYLRFDYGDRSDYDIDYGYPYDHFYERDEKDLFYTKEEVLNEIEIRKNKLSNKLKDKDKLIKLLYKKAKANLTDSEIELCKQVIKE